MASGEKAKGLKFKKCVDIIQDVSVVTSRPLDPPTLASHLLRLLPCLESCSLTAEDLSTLRHKIWQLDLIHLIIEVLREDFSSKVDRWRMLTNLAVTLASVVAGLNPKEPKKIRVSSKSSEDITEYYDILLPTATDSILILASNMVESLEGSEPDSHRDSSLLECFQKVMDSLLWLCSAHKQCIPRTLNSPYLLNLLITDHFLYGHTVLSALETLILTDKTSPSALLGNILTNILDELVYKLSGSDRDGALLSFRLLAQFSVLLPNLAATLCESYSGLISLIRKWIPEDEKLGAAEEYLLSELSSREGKQGELDEKERAAVFIQASWRGYASRKKMIKAQRGIRRFQQMYRRKKSEKLKRRETKEKIVIEASLKKSNLMSGQLAFHEKQLSVYEQLPAAQLQDFIQNQERKASIAIQSAWRGFTTRSKLNKLEIEAKRKKSAVLIQRTFRRHSLAKKQKEQASKYKYLPEIPEPARQKLQEEVTRHRESHPHRPHQTKEQASELHEEAQKEYEKFYFSQGTHTRREEETKLLISKLNRNCDLLLNAPSLEEAYSLPGIEECFSSSSPVVGRMARTAHREELRAMDSPWWKRKPLDHNELKL